MKYERINSNLFTDTRHQFSNQIQAKSLAIFFSNDILPTNADGTLPFKQNSDLFYLSGVDQEETILVLFPDAKLPEQREMLFVKETNEHIAVWEGAKLDKKNAFEVSGVRNVFWLQDFDTQIKNVMAQAENVYLNSNEHLRANTEVETREVREGKRIREQFSLHTYKRSAPIMHSIRSVKHSIEIELMQQACDITNKAFRRLLPFVKPGVMEYEIEAELIHEFVRNRSRGFAYTPIIASGASACVLHYIENNQECKDGDLLLMDIGAEYANYASDLTRCIPVNGKFSARQKEVYNAVLRVQRESMKLLKPSVLLADYHKEVGDLMTKELLGLKLLDKHDIEKQDPKWPAYKKYFMHGTSHYIGLDVHDVGSWAEPMQAGNAFTVEPGIYIQEEGLGIRIENDIVLTQEGFIDLMADIPVEVDEIEGLMNS